MDSVSQRNLQILTEIAERPNVTQRGLAGNLGIALGLTNLYLKRLSRKGYVKITRIQPNRLRYLLTPQGILEKSRLTYEFASLSITLYKQTRGRLRDAIRPMILAGQKRFALYGTGEAAELTYLTLREMGVEPLAVYADDGDGSFLGMPVRPKAELAGSDVDQVVVASFERLSGEAVAELNRLVPEDKLIVLNRGVA
jgi:DNA-binding MarR family transcriptional regulator